jgi:hypothetical protein
MIEQMKMRFEKIKHLKDSYSTSPLDSETEEYCIKSGKWLYQANLTNAKYTICIKSETIRVEFPSNEFLYLEDQYFSCLAIQIL